jgi:murein L,D-transpeptidase YafK
MLDRKFLGMAAVLSLGLALAGCQDENGYLPASPKAIRPLAPETVKLMDEKGMRKEDPILVRIFKQDSTLEVWKRDKTGRYALLKDYKICAWGGTIGPKIKQGDKQSPEGFYTVKPWQMNPNSAYYLSYDIGFPNAFDRAWGRTGADIMVHGACSSAGCFAMTDEQVGEIYALAREAFAGGQQSFQVQSFPFRMTAQNLAKHRSNPNMAFWKNLKEGYDHFEVTKLEPKVDVCEKRYVFDAQTTDFSSSTFNASGACPTYKVPEHIAVAVAAKAKADDEETRVAVAALDEKDKAAIERELEKKLAESRPKPAETSILAFFGGGTDKPAAADAAPPAMTPIAVPLPRPAPGRPPVVAVAAAETKSSDGVFGSLFGGSAEAKPIAAAAPPTVTATVSAPKPASTAVASAAGGPVKPAAQAPGAAAPATTASATTASAGASAEKPESKSWWQRINPF